MKLINGFMKGNNLLDKFLLVIYGLLVIILHMNLLTDKARKKKFYPLHSVSTSIAKYNISPIKKSYVIPSVIIFHLSVCPLMNLTYKHQTNCLLFCR